MEYVLIRYPLSPLYIQILQNFGDDKKRQPLRVLSVIEYNPSDPDARLTFNLQFSLERLSDGALSYQQC